MNFSCEEGLTNVTTLPTLGTSTEMEEGRFLTEPAPPGQPQDTAETPSTFLRIDSKWDQGDYLLFENKGKVSPGSKTNKYLIHSRHSKAVLGHVFWYSPWRQYVMMPVNSVFDKKCLREVADFCEKVTTEHRAAAEAHRQEARARTAKAKQREIVKKHDKRLLRKQARETMRGDG